MLARIRARGANRIVCLGDVATLGVAPGEVVDLLREIDGPCILGNHDEYLLDPEQLAFLGGFAAGLELPLPGDRTLELARAARATGNPMREQLLAIYS